MEDVTTSLLILMIFQYVVEINILNKFFFFGFVLDILVFGIDFNFQDICKKSIIITNAYIFMNLLFIYTHRQLPIAIYFLLK